MASLNEVRIMGNLGADPELRYTASGTAVCTLSIATTRQWTDKNDERHEETEWHRVVVWAGQAESVHKHKRKGDQLIICGRLQTREWEDKDGAKRYSTEIVAEQVLFTGRAPKNGPSHPADDPNLEEPPRARDTSSGYGSAPSSRSSTSKPAGTSKPNTRGKKTDSLDDDHIPPPSDRDF